MRIARAFLVLVVGCLGCSNAKPYNTAAVTGRVTLDGQPLAGARLTFQPERGPNAGLLSGPEAHGETDENGYYTLRTVFDDRGGTIGRNRVTISTRKIERPANNPDAPAKQISAEKVPKKYFTAKDWLYFEVPA